MIVTIAPAFLLSSENILKNGNMSDPKGEHYSQYGTWIHHYKMPEGCKVSYDAGTFVSKPQSIRIESDGNTIALHQNLKLESGRKYKIPFSVKIDKIVLKWNQGGVVLNICDGQNYWFPSKWLTGTTDLTKYGGTFIAGGKKRRFIYAALPQ